MSTWAQLFLNTKHELFFKMMEIICSDKEKFNSCRNTQCLSDYKTVLK